MSLVSKVTIAQRNSYTMKPENETVKVDAKNWTVEASGLITWIVVLGAIGLGAAYIYGKYFHVKVKAKIQQRRDRKNAKRKSRKEKD